MRATTRSLGAALALAVPISLIGASCSSSSDTSSTGGSTGGSSMSSDMDFASLSGSLQGSGATFPKAFYDEARAEFATVAPDLQVEYSGGGSGKGKQDLANEVVQWAGSDSLVKEEDIPTFKGGEFLYFPTVAAPITVSYNLGDVENLQLSPDTLAGLMQGDITTWNASEIAEDNPGVTLPDTPVVIAHRSDGSGTTSNFTKYLDAASEVWTLGAGDTVEWPADSQAGNGNAGVAQIVKDTDGAIGYVDFSDAVATGLTFAAIKNKDGNYVEASLEGATAAVEGAEVKDDLTYNPLNAGGADTYPITAPTYILVYVSQPDQTQLDNITGWLTYLLTDGQTLAPEVDFAPLPSDLQSKAMAQLDELKVG